MKSILLIVSLFFQLLSFAQTSGEVVFFDNSGYKMLVVLNGIQQNREAESNVRLTGLQPGFYSCKILASDNSYALEKNIIVKSDTLITYHVINKRGKRRLRFFSEVALQSAPASDATQSVVTYHSEAYPETINSTTQTTVTQVESTSQVTEPNTPESATMDVNIAVSGSGTSPTETGTDGSSGVVHTQVHTTTQETSEGIQSNSTVGSENGSVSISMSVSENGANVNIQGSGMEGQEGVTMNTEVSGVETTSQSNQTISTTTTTTTTTTQSGDWNSVEHTTIHEPEPEMSTDDVIADCFVGEEDFDLFLRTMRMESFDDDKTRLAKHYVEKKCLSVSQIGTIMDALTFSEDRMTVAKAAYALCYESSEYHALTEKFTFSDDKEALLEFIESK